MGTSGRANANLEAKWLFPTPFAPVKMIFFNQDSLSCYLIPNVSSADHIANGCIVRFVVLQIWCGERLVQ
jgi:hypothetical protein